MPKKEQLTKENIIRDLVRAEEIRHARVSSINVSLIGDFLIAAVFAALLTRTVWVGVPILLGSVYNAVRLIQKIRIFRTNTSAIEKGGFVIDTDVLSHIAQERIYEPHISGRGRRIRFNNYRTVTYYYFDNCRFRECFFGGFEWSKEYYLSKNGLQNISLAGDEFYVAVRSSDGEVGQIYPKKFFDYDREGETKI